MIATRIKLSFAAAAASLLLSACGGFTPLYATPGVTPSLQAVDVVTPSTRAGFLLREKIDDQLARKLDRPAQYRLNLRVDEQRYPRGLRVNNVASDFELDLRVAYELVEVGTSRKLSQGFVPISVFYVSADAPYAGIAAQQDAQERAANQVAIQIRLDLSRYFSRLAANGAVATP